MLAFGFNEQEKSSIRNLRIGALLTFIAVNLRFIVGDIIKPLILFGILQPGNSEHGHRYEFHTPNLPDMCGDVVMIILFAVAYLFMMSLRVKNNIPDVLDKFHGTNSQSVRSSRNVREYAAWAKSLFFVTIVGFSLYFFSKYFLTTSLEAFFSEESESFDISFVLHILNSTIKLGAALIFVYAYCRYLCIHRYIKIVLYMFFFIRTLLLTNILGFITEYDMEIDAPILDILLPGILIYSIISFMIIKYRVRHAVQGDWY
ncbi:MAG: hypothetical protein HRF42_06240 [Candidatus Brocadia sp.]|jgi:serine/threonine protein kinase